MSERLPFLKKMAEESPDDPFFLYAICVEYRALGLQEKALTDLNSLIDKFPDYIPAYHILGQLYLEKEESAKAREVLCSGIQLSKVAGNKKAAAEMQALVDEIDF
jgi:tetratricopeptide (TPR) repeat protein